MAIPLPFQSAKALAAGIRRGKLSSQELLDLYLKRTEKYNPRINAIIAMDSKAARVRARAADIAIAKGELWGPLHGVPMTIKESFDAVRMPTTWGLPELKDNYPKRDALAVERFRNAGAVLFGKTNVPAMLGDWQTFNAIYGTTNNPWDLSRVPGGSSGGSAAALAAGLTALDAGSDIGASIRDPAHFCGVYGHKPTFGICPTNGQALPGMVAAQDITVVGPLARGADDLELALSVMAGPDEIEGRGMRLSLPVCRKRSLRDFRVAVMLSAETAAVDRSVQDCIQAVADFVAKAKARVSDTARPEIDTADVHRIFIQLLRAATSRGQSDEVFADNFAAAQKVDRRATDYRSWMLTGNTMSHRDWLHWNEMRHRIRHAWARFFEKYDVLLCPAGATPAFPHNQTGERWERMVNVNGKPQPSTTQMFWAGFSGMAYLPSTVAPAGLSPEGLPVGVQIVGPQYGDLTCIRFAQLLEREYGGFVAPPGYA
ncbi:MAG TPA: amidase [Burkholderiales bacterium]|nr:amidase [Burkholderiales bacterium]